MKCQQLIVVLLLFPSAWVSGGATFNASIQAGDMARQQRNLESAMVQYRLAFDQAQNHTDQGIALGKQAEVLADDLKDFSSARAKAQSVLKLTDAAPIARVVAQRVIAKCQMHDEKWTAAIETLYQAKALEGVQWAQPTLALMLGDCYRQTDQHQAALDAYRQAASMTTAGQDAKATAYLNIGLVYQYGLRKSELAKSAFAKAIELNQSLRAEISFHLSTPNDEREKPLLMAHYMPWYVAPPTADDWGWHWTMNHFDPSIKTKGRRRIASHYDPLIGPYDSGDSRVLEYHLLLMKLAGIDGVIVDWYGLTDHRDYATLHRNAARLVQQLQRMQMKLIVCYEDQTITALIKANRLQVSERVKHVTSELKWLAANWMSSDDYVRVNKKPVLLSFGHAGLSDQEWDNCLKNLDDPFSYFSEHIKRECALGGFDWPIPRLGIQQSQRFNQLSKRWPRKIPVAFPRFHDIYKQANAGEGYALVPDRDGKTLQETLESAIHSNAFMVQIATWNDWGEGTQIEPSEQLGYRDLEIIQSHRFEQTDLERLPSLDDLRMPKLIWELRHSKRVDSAKIDEVVFQIIKGDLPEARVSLEQLLSTKRNQQPSKN